MIIPIEDAGVLSQEVVKILSANVGEGMYMHVCTRIICVPYSGKFSRVAIFTDVGFWSFSHFNFRGWALRQSHTPNFTNPDAIKPCPLVLHMHSKSSETGVKYKLYWADLTMSELRSCVVEAMIRGYHQYQSIWEAEVGENLTCVREPSNVRDPYAAAVTKPESSTIVGHIPRKMSAICSLFLRKGGSIFCQVSVSRCYSQDLPQGGLKIPCLLRFQGNAKDVQKVKKLATLALSLKTSSHPESPPSLEPPTKKVRVDKKHDMPDDFKKENSSRQSLWHQGSCEAYTKSVFEGRGV